MFSDAIQPLVSSTIYNDTPTTSKLHFCGYSVLKNTLSARNSTAKTKIIDAIKQNTNLAEKESLLLMHFSKVRVINATNTSEPKIKDAYNLNTEYDLGLCIDEKKLQSAWENIDRIVDVSSSPSWTTTIVCGASVALISSFLANKEVSYLDILYNIIQYSSFAGLIKSGYNFVRDVTGSKPRLLQLNKIKANRENSITSKAIEESRTNTSISKKDSRLAKTFIDMSDFLVIFDNLYRFLGLSSHQTLAFFNAALIGIVDTWFDAVCEKSYTEGELTEIDTNVVNKKIIENTLLALELNRFNFQAKQNIKPDEDDMFIAALRAKNSIYTEKLQLENRDKTNFVARKSILRNNLDALEQGFYTMGVNNFFALCVKEYAEEKVYCLFIPLQNLLYHSSSVDEICNLISKFGEYRNISLHKIGGEIK